MALQLVDTRRASSSATFRVNNFDLLRLLAALQVMFFHAIDRLNLADRHSFMGLRFFSGVPIFFVASGFMVSAAFERQEWDWRAFLRNRVLRIAPGLWACILVTAVVTFALGFMPRSLADFAWVPAQMLGFIYTPSYLSGFGSGTYNGALWTIPLEIQFYLALPLVYAFACRTASNRKLLLVFVLSVMASIGLAHVWPPYIGTGTLDKAVNRTLFPQFYLFLFGVVLQRFRVYEWRAIAGKGLYWSAAFLAYSYLEPGWGTTHTVALLVLGITAISLAYTVPKLSKSLLRGQDISYGLYMYHGLLINLFVVRGLAGRWSGYWLLVAASILVAALSWVLIEKPALRLKRPHSDGKKSLPVEGLLQT
jgi:peptidoglycan/LPS O-acetylase OafA/YrhL